MAEFGNFHNQLMANSNKDVIPEAGMGATKLSWSDRDPYTIIEVISKNRIRVQEDSATHNGEPFTQSWDIQRDSKGKILELIKTKKGWKILKGTTRFIIGVRDKYFDYEF